MAESIRTAVYDTDLRLEAYRLQGVAQTFPCHFHDYYVIGLIEAGQRRLQCGSQEYIAEKESVLIFCPGAPHACVQHGGGLLDYRGLNIQAEVMLDLAEEAAGRRILPGFSPSVISDPESACCLRTLHQLLMDGSQEFGKEEALLLLFSLLIRRYGEPFEEKLPACGAEVEKARVFMEDHCGERLSLEQICRHVGLSKSALLRAFVRAKGVTPYRYLENIRIGRARALLEQGIPPAETALRTGFADQSHFTNYFSRFTGLSPGLYQEIFSGKGDRKHGLTK